VYQMNVKEFELQIEYEWAREKTLDVKEIKSLAIYLIAKRMLDIICSLMALVALSPLFLILAVVIRLTSRGSAIYKQNRVGRDGSLFPIYKFRSMVNGADNLSIYLTPELQEYYKINRKISDDPRVTKVGKILRRTSLDELPQIINIFKGEMSIVGPRPLLPDEIEMYGKSFERYASIKPGLTGLWQIKSRSRTSMIDRAMLDNEYFKKKNFTYDLSILVKTVGVVLSRKGAC
jgi:lipopolysaccharide/colanic/teichoic acid biosynthesis glycosyltransferase